MITVDDQDYILLVVSFVLLLGLFFSLYHKWHSVAVKSVLSLEMSALTVLVWNTFVGETFTVVYTTNTLYLCVATVILAFTYYFLYDKLGSMLFGILTFGILAAIFIVGRSKFESYWQSTFNVNPTDDVMAVVFLVVVMVLFVLKLWFASWINAWMLVDNFFMGFGLTMAIDVIVQENPTNQFSDNMGLDLLAVNTWQWWVKFCVCEIAYLVLYYRLICGGRPLEKQPSPTTTKAKKKKRSRFSLPNHSLFVRREQGPKYSELESDSGSDS